LLRLHPSHQVLNELNFFI